MIVSIWESSTELANNFNRFIENNFDNPFLWIVLFIVLLLIAVVTISNLADK